jgi:eukaryotic-like serine/threonine-protein kinase
MLRPDGFVKVLDFGLAKLTSAVVSAATDATQTAFRTDAGTVVGTVAYMSPEQARGQPVDARTDIWSLGVMLYEMVAGRGPFTALSSSDVLAAILQNEPVPLTRFDPDTPPELQRIVSKALRKDRAQRYQTITDLRLDLEALRSEPQASSVDAASVAASALRSATTPSPIRRESSAEYILRGRDAEFEARSRCRPGIHACGCVACGKSFTRPGRPKRCEDEAN